MEIIFMDTEISKTTGFNKFQLYFTNKSDLRGDKTVALANLSIH